MLQDSQGEDSGQAELILRIVEQSQRLPQDNNNPDNNDVIQRSKEEVDSAEESSTESTVTDSDGDEKGGDGAGQQLDAAPESDEALALALQSQLYNESWHLLLQHAYFS